MYIVTVDGNILHNPTIGNYQILDPVIKLEVNTPNFFDFIIYPSNPMYSSIKRMKSIIEVYDDGELIFRGRPLNDELRLDKSKAVQCEGERAYLNDSQMIPYNHHGSVRELLNKFIQNHNSQVETSKQFTLGDVTVDGRTEDGRIVRSSIEYSNTWEEIKNKLINNLGGYLVLRRENDTNYIDYIADSPYQSGQSVELTKNILDYQQEIKADEIATVIIPLGARLEDEEGQETDVRLDISSVNNGKPYIEHTEGINKYGRIWAVQIWDDVTLPANLKSRGQSSLNALVNLGVKLVIKAVDLNLVDNSIPKIKHFNYIRVLSKPHQIDELMLIKKQTIHLDRPEQNTIEVGVEFSTFTEKQLQSDHTIKQIQSDYITNEKVHKILNPIHLQVSSILQDFESIQLSVRDIQTTYQEIIDSPITAYEIAVSNGFTGTQEEFLESLKGKDGTSVKILGVKDNQSQLPTANNIAGDGYMIEGDLWIWTGTQWTNVGRIQGQNGKDGIGYQLILTGDDGLVFDSTTDTIARTLRAKVYVNNKDVTDTLPNSYFLWTRQSNYSDIDTQFNNQGIRNKVLTLSSYYLKTNATYKCTLVIPSINGYLLDKDYNFILDGQGNKIIASSYSLTFEQQITIVKDVQPQITTLTSEVNLLAGQIELKVNQSTVDQLSNRVATNESNITLTQNEITSKVSQTDFTGANVVSMINQTASSVKIQAKNISLEGLTTVNNNFVVGLDGSITARNGSFHGNVSVTGGSLNINNRFKVDTSGNLVATNVDLSGKITATSGSFTGSITATSGKIGMLGITSALLEYRPNPSNNVNRTYFSGDPNDTYVLASYNSSGTRTFSIARTGGLYATGADISGTITATDGKIGGWTIENGRLSHTSTGGMLILSTINDYYIWAGPDGLSSNFYLSKNGTLQAKNADISGKITATSGTFTGTVSGSSITGGSINIGNGNFTVNSSGVVVAKSITTTGTHNGTGQFGSGYHNNGSFSYGSFGGTGYLSSGTLAGNNFYQSGSSTYIENLASNSVYGSRFMTLDTSTGYSKVMTISNGSWNIVNSDIRLKTDIEDVHDEMNKIIYSLPIISYRYKGSKEDEQRRVGINANFVDKMLGRENTQYFLSQDEQGFYSVQYEMLTPMLVKVVQSQNSRLIDLEWKIKELERKLQ